MDSSLDVYADAHRMLGLMGYYLGQPYIYKVFNSHTLTSYCNMQYRTHSQKLSLDLLSVQLPMASNDPPAREDSVEVPGCGPPSRVEVEENNRYLLRKVARLSRENDIMRKRLAPVIPMVGGLIRQGRGTKRNISMFEPIDELLAEGDRRSEEAQAEDAVEHRHTAAEDRLNRGLSEFKKLKPDIVAKLEGADDGDELLQWLGQLRKGADQARSTDAHVMKASIIDYLAEDNGKPLDPPLDRESKYGRGLHHEATGRLLCPAIWDWSNISVRTKIRNGDPNYKLTPAHWPALFYANYKCDLGDLEKGLFYSPILVKGYKLLFQSPTAAHDYSLQPDQHLAGSSQVSEYRPPHKRSRRKANTRRTVASLMRVREVTPRAIAYVCVQEHFSLSSIPAWNDDIVEFDYPALYNNIVDYFECIPGPTAQTRVNACLSWWNDQCYPNRPRIPDNSSEVPGMGGSGSVARMAEQRCAKERRT
ncbi:hypothetical protein EVJ58_g7537 [Rhodofomes roseus]|uniref:Uncharacterized protein n=1 Tax=Rhodofomes roseus TaxID=34475 RepID=A0A4Y9Y737_9APHY|nr:hypothetical protein EVJ58_g7537 [Rhodofomes roseus]